MALSETGLVAASDLLAVEVDRQVVGRERRRHADGRRQLGAAQDGLDPGQQLQWTERLGDVVVGADLQAPNLVQLLAARRQHQDRRVGDLADPPQHLEPIQARQADVQQHDVRRLVEEAGQRRLAVGRRENVDALPLELEAEP